MLGDVQGQEGYHNAIVVPDAANSSR